MKDHVGVEDFPMTGYSVLLKTIDIPGVTKGGVHLLQSTINMEKIEHDIGLVLGMGIEAYTDKSRFPFGPRCKVGEWVIFSKYEQQRLPLYKNTCFLVNDDRIITSIPEYLLEAIVPHYLINISKSVNQ